MSLWYWAAIVVVVIGICLCAWIEIDAPATQNPDDYSRLIGQFFVAAIALVIAAMLALSGLLMSYL